MSPLSPTAPADPPLLLVVEDSKYDRMILTEAFREAELNLSLRFVIHGEDLLDYLRCRNAYAMPHAGSSPAVILMDLNMPRMNGLDALKEIRADVRLRMLPVVILSTSDDAMQITRAYALGVNAFMTKPSRFRGHRRPPATLRRFLAGMCGASEAERVLIPPEPGMRILLVDDSRAYHEEFAQLLKESGVSVEVLDVASSAVDGARLMAQDVHDIYFVDYRLPGDSGLALVKAARQAGVTKPIIILTGYDSPTIDAAAEAVGASDYLRKGEFSPPLLSRAIRYALRNVAALTMIREVESRFDVARDAAQAAAYHGALALVSSQMEAQVGHADLEVSEAVNAELRKLVEERTASLMRAVEQRRNAEDSLRQGEKLQAIGLLTGGIAHDFNNFLQIVLSGVALLRPSTLTEERRLDLLDKIGEAATNAVKFTDRMLAFARKRVLQPEAFDVDSRLAGMFDLLRPVLGSQIRLETDFAPEPWPVIADPHQLEVAILNLAINARDAMLPKGGTLCFQTRNVTLEATPERAAGDYVCLAVRDSGTGMSPATMARVFEPFFTTKASGRGTGLGLAQVYGFAKQSDGDVTIESTLEEGTTVFVHLPRHLSGVRGQAAVAWADDTAAWRDGAAVLPSGITRADR